MVLDVATSIVLFAGISLMAGLAVACHALRKREISAYAPWLAGFLIIPIGSVLILARGHIPDAVSIGLSNILTFLGVGFLWYGLARLDHQPIPLWRIAIAPSLWLAACLVPAIYASLSYRAAVFSFLGVGMSLAVAWTSWSARAERLASRTPFVLLCLCHAAFHGFRGIYALSVTLPNDLFQSDPVMAISLIEPGLGLFASILLGFDMARERVEKQLGRVASTDALTGLLNRRAFHVVADEAIERMRRARGPVTLLLFDLDHFKQVNDRFGHAAGDSVLVAFAEVLTKALGSGDQVARLGGEEFAALLPGAGAGIGKDMAERIRRAFSARRIEHGGRHIPVTVSVGMVAREAREASLDGLLDLADRALYAAKGHGRDRVALAEAKAA